MIYILRKQKWLYQSKVHSSLVSIHNCKMVYWTRLSYTESLIVCVLFFVSSGSAGYQYSTNTFLYSLKNYYGYGYFKQDITNGYSSSATYSYYYYGPTFGGGHDMYIADNAGRNTNSYFSCHSYRRPYCDYSIWVGTRYGNNFRPDELGVYYEVLAWNWAATRNKGNRGVGWPFWQVRTQVHMVFKTSYKITFLLSLIHNCQFTGLFTMKRDIKKRF